MTGEDYNDWVWQKAIDLSHKMFHKMKGFAFHHEISTDRVAASILSPEKQLKNSQGPYPPGFVLLKNLKVPNLD